MNIKGKEILEEIKSVISGKTLDAIFPPLIFIFSNNLMGLNRAIVFSLVIALILAATRFIRKQNWKYALGGLLGVSIASGLAYLTKSAANYFIGSIISSSLF